MRDVRTDIFARNIFYCITVCLWVSSSPWTVNKWPMSPSNLLSCCHGRWGRSWVCHLCSLWGRGLPTTSGGLCSASSDCTVGGIRKAKAWSKIQLSRDVKGNQKETIKYVKKNSPKKNVGTEYRGQSNNGWCKEVWMYFIPSSVFINTVSC